MARGEKYNSTYLYICNFHANLPALERKTLRGKKLEDFFRNGYM